MEVIRGQIFDIEHSSFVDGPGIRTTVFFKGCNLRCAWCHNPESQRAETQMMIYRDKCVGCGKCAAVCPHRQSSCDLCGTCALYCPVDARQICGKTYTAEELLCEALKDKAFYDASGGGVTCSGGECMLQPELLGAFLRLCRENGIHTAVDTAGHVPFSSFERILPHTDLFLYDVKCMDSARHKQYTGVGNEQILDNLARLLRLGAPLWVRIPVIPTVNDSPEDMRRIKEFLARHGKPQKVELLPYHAMGEHKYSALGKEVTRFSAPDEEQMASLRAIFA